MVAALREEMLARLAGGDVAQSHVITSLRGLAVSGGMTRALWDAALASIKLSASGYADMPPEALTQVGQGRAQRGRTLDVMQLATYAT
jgi:hypothetical protein